MVRRLKQLSSIDNLTARATRARAGGQIATFLLLMIMAALVFALMTANLGSRAITATQASNAADQSALLLGSQLSTKALQLYEALGNRYEKCKRGGFLSIILAIVVAIVLIVLVVFCPPVGAAFMAMGLVGKAAIIAAGTLGGAIGGATGGAIAGTGAAQGAFQGAMVGAAIGMGVASFGNAGVLAGPSLPGAVPIWATPVLASTTGAVVGGGLAIGSSLYNAVIQDSASAAALDAALKSLNKFPERMRMEQGVIFDALQRTVDDAERVPDENDVDGDGNTTEKLSRFIKLWDDRVNGKDLRDKLKQLTDKTRDFVNGPLAEFRQAADAASARHGFLARKEIEERSGILEQVVERLEDPSTRGSSTNRTAYPVSFWETGPSKDAYTAWADSEDPNLQAPAGTDETDVLIADLQDIVGIVDALKAQDMESLMASWRSWVAWFYDAELHEPPPPEPPEDPAAAKPVTEKVSRAGFKVVPRSTAGTPVWIAGTTKPPHITGSKLDAGDFVDYYTTLGWQVDGHPPEHVAGMKAWRLEIQRLKNGLPPCHIETRPIGFRTFESYVANPPCHNDDHAPKRPGFGSIDRDLTDEFKPLEAKLDDGDAAVAQQQLIPKIQHFRQDVQAFSAEMKDLEARLLTQISTAQGGLAGFSGNNPTVYRWQDARGDHAVEAQLGPFRIPWLRKKKSGNFLMNKVCVILTDHQDLTGQRTWVRIAQHHPTNKAMGIWSWNPTAGAP